MRRSPRSRRPSTPASCGAITGNELRQRHVHRRRRAGRSRGRATSRRCWSRTRARTRTSSGRSPTRAGCSGPTTWPSPRAPRTRRRPRCSRTGTTRRPTRPQIAASVNYVCPVKGADEAMVDHRSRTGRPTPSSSPTRTMAKRLYQFRSLDLDTALRVGDASSTRWSGSDRRPVAARGRAGAR